MASKKPQQAKGPGALTKRPPVVAVLGHIDHGKSTLLDYIRNTHVVDEEAGGITQRISAYEVERAGQRITFIDTPGHEAFSGMRERGANAADVAILVVSAEDGVKPQTVEAYNQIEKAKVPFVVAINKVDKPNANVDRTKQSLAEAGIYVEGYGGSVSFAAISAKTGQGVDELLDLVLLSADILELKGDLSAPAKGSIIEAHRDAKKGISAVLVVKDGTLGAGMFVASGDAYAPTRMIESTSGKKLAEATFSSPIRLTGWNKAPQVGAQFVTFESKKELEAHLEELEDQRRQPATKPGSNGAGNGQAPAGADLVDASGQPVEKKIVPVIVKADVLGSVEAIEHELRKLKSDRVALKVLHASIGNITESDIKFAGSGNEAVVVGFNVRTDAQAQAMIDRLGLAHASFDIIYKLVEWVEALMKERTPKMQVEEVLGKAKILKFFSRTKDRQIIGGKVTDREIRLGHRVKIYRRETIIGDGQIRELQQAKVKTSSVAEGFEFGAMIEAKIELAPGDVLEDFEIVEK